jgi:hypothetical protein
MESELLVLVDRETLVVRDHRLFERVGARRRARALLVGIEHLLVAVRRHGWEDGNRAESREHPDFNRSARAVEKHRPGQKESTLCAGTIRRRRSAPKSVIRVCVLSKRQCFQARRSCGALGLPSHNPELFSLYLMISIAKFRRARNYLFSR